MTYIQDGPWFALIDLVLSVGKKSKLMHNLVIEPSSPGPKPNSLHTKPLEKNYSNKKYNSIFPK